MAKLVEDETEIIPTGCSDWSLNVEADSKKEFWWNKPYGISVWRRNVTVNDACLSEVTDDDVWTAFLTYQKDAVYKLCTICDGPEANADMKICCYCGLSVHAATCSKEAEDEQMRWKACNSGFEEHLAVCRRCDDVPFDKRDAVNVPDNCRRAVRRALTIASEYPPAVSQKLHRLAKMCEAKPNDAALLDRVQQTVSEYFQPHESADMLTKQVMATKDGGLGVVATMDIPKNTVVGVYPGYEDPLSGEQAKCGRPGPRYSLVDLNCANYFNDVFTEFSKCFTPFFNEPNPQEHSNVAWIQETTRPEGRLSVMTVRDIREGEELLIGYGPLYPRTYPHNYDAYAFHLVDGYKDPPCFALWHWATLDEDDAKFEGYIGYAKETDGYVHWRTEDDEDAPPASPSSPSSPAKPKPAPPAAN
jgi:hypothetical protein